MLLDSLISLQFFPSTSLCLVSSTFCWLEVSLFVGKVVSTVGVAGLTPPNEGRPLVRSTWLRPRPSARPSGRNGFSLLPRLFEAEEVDALE